MPKLLLRPRYARRARPAWACLGAGRPGFAAPDADPRGNPRVWGCHFEEGLRSCCWPRAKPRGDRPATDRPATGRGFTCETPGEPSTCHWSLRSTPFQAPVLPRTRRIQYTLHGRTASMCDSACVPPLKIPAPHILHICRILSCAVRASICFRARVLALWQSTRAMHVQHR